MTYVWLEGETHRTASRFGPSQTCRLADSPKHIWCDRCTLLLSDYIYLFLRKQSAVLVSSPNVQNNIQQIGIDCSEGQ